MAKKSLINKRKRTPSSALVLTTDVSFAADRMPICVNLGFVDYALENWHTKDRFRFA